MERYDKNGDGVISYSEFCEEIKPHSPKKKLYKYWINRIFNSLI